MYQESNTSTRESFTGKLTLLETLSNSYSNGNITFNGVLYEIHFNNEGNAIYCNASLDKFESLVKKKSKIRINKIFPPSLSMEKFEKSYKKKIWNFDTEWPIEDGKSYFLIVQNGKLVSDIKASEDTSYQRGYRQLLKEEALKEGIKLEDNLLGIVFDDLDRKVLDFFNKKF